MLDAARLVGLLAEPDRRRVFAALVLDAGTVEEISARSGLSKRAVVDALDRLQNGGLVVASHDHYVLIEAAFKNAARAAAPPPSPSKHSDETHERRVILDSAFRDGRLVHLPSKEAKRLVVLDHIAQSFEPGAKYTERQVNATLSAIDEDVSALRRYLVDYGFLDRKNGEYWRSGGTV